MARISLLLLASALIATTSATDLEHDTLKPFQIARFAASNNASISQISDNGLLPRYLSCTGGAHACRAGQCCLYSCCADGTCCGAAELCYNDKQPSKGPTYCCTMYTEKQCDTGCVPMQSECCGDGYYCEYGYKCTSGGCCRWGRTCRGGSSNIGSGNYDDDDDDDDTETTTTSTRTYAPETDSTSSSTSTTEPSTITDTESSRDSTSTDSDTTTSSSSTETVESTSTSSTTSTRSTSVATAIAAPNPAGQAGDSAASSYSIDRNTRLITVLAGVVSFLRL